MKVTDVRPGFWAVVGGQVCQLSTEKACPQCGTGNRCEDHRFLNHKWYVNWAPWAAGEGQELPVFRTYGEAVRFNGGRE
jgi:hypothetical protein